MSARARPLAAARDQHESAFASILADLVARVPGARGAALVDRDGETVDYSGRLDPFAMRLAAAHWRIVLDELTAQPFFRNVRWLALRAGKASYLVHELPDAYALVVALARAGGFFGWRRAVAVCARELGEEAGWRWSGACWFPARVSADERRRPASVRTGPADDRGAHPIEILGAVAGGLARRERAWRVRFDTGIEATLVREPGGVWYSDEPLEGDPAQRARPRKTLGKTRAPRVSVSAEEPVETKAVDSPPPLTTVRRPTDGVVFHPAGQVEELRTFSEEKLWTTPKPPRSQPWPRPRRVVTKRDPP